MKHLLLLIITLSISCDKKATTQIDKKQSDEPAYEKGFISSYKSDTTSGKIVDTAFIFGCLTIFVESIRNG